MSEPIILVTGSTDGIGKATARELASRGAGLILHGRDERKGRKVQEELGRAAGHGKPDLVIADFSDMGQVRSMAAEIASRYDHLDVLVNDAGTYQRRHRLTRDGVEMTFAVNYLAPFLLTRLLLPLLLRSAPSRIVTVASSAHEDVDHIDWENLPAGRRYRAWDAYALSKFADIAFTYRLAGTLTGTGVTANCLHPGVTDTRILRTAFPGMAGITPEEAARTPVYLALSPEVAGTTGRYFEDRRPVPSSRLTHDPSVQERFWNLAERLTTPAV